MSAQPTKLDIDSAEQSAAAEDAVLRLLVVDDEPMLRTVITEFVKVMGIAECIEAADGQEALEILRSSPVDVVLSDIRMPNMNLGDLLEITRAEFPDLAVIATSGMSDMQNACHILDAGAHEFLAKPLNLDHLEQTLEWLPERRAILRQAQGLSVANGANGASNHDSALNEVRRRIEAYSGPYRSQFRHAVRVSDLAGELMTDENPAAAEFLKVAALLHELGASTLMRDLAGKRMKLTEMERTFIRRHYQVCSRLLERTLAESHAADIVRDHLEWCDGGASAAAPDEAGPTAGLSARLSVLNAIDALVHERPDRPALSVGEAREFVCALERKSGLPAAAEVLALWPKVDRFYADREAC